MKRLVINDVLISATQDHFSLFSGGVLGPRPVLGGFDKFEGVGWGSSIISAGPGRVQDCEGVVVVGP